ncbi:Zn-ribbon domain-containing OB-fold protein [Conexibacter sp. CPCC 206217]|uniref:Zn-ribbon domain-containing OB-fold protein n=1 Tax=Conexibacter sp. CPCC 206217 TaxID=3064574 RepID=UPI002726DEDF|nr:Zn-ribbon domain-containing OB-fold protein [Conexibacter sp. CPCC 206217]MDO8212237.1 Zn-ribbon domain-containing OB-fold protein [Conexibacter sp. CPCC 206217]
MSSAAQGAEVRSLTPGAEYWERLRGGAVPYQRCETCGEAVFFPRVLCPACGSTQLAWRDSGGRGTVYSATTVHLRGVDPYTVALVDLEEGIRVMVRIDDATPDEPPIGREVLVVAGELDGEPALRAALATEVHDG